MFMIQDMSETPGRGVNLSLMGLISSPVQPYRVHHHHDRITTSASCSMTKIDHGMQNHISARFRGPRVTFLQDHCIFEQDPSG